MNININNKSNNITDGKHNKREEKRKEKYICTVKIPFKGGNLEKA